MQFLYRVSVTCLEDPTQPTFTCLTSIMETLEQRRGSA